MFYMSVNEVDIDSSQQQGLLTIHPDSADSIAATREAITQNNSNEQHHQHRPRRTANDGSAVCPICLNNAEYGVETNCGHCFCGKKCHLDFKWIIYTIFWISYFITSSFLRFEMIKLVRYNILKDVYTCFK